MPSPSVSARAIGRALAEVGYILWSGAPRGVKCDPNIVILAIEAVVATRAGKPIDIAELSKRVRLPRSTVVRHLKIMLQRAALVEADYAVTVEGKAPTRRCLEGAFGTVASALAAYHGNKT